MILLVLKFKDSNNDFKIFELEFSKIFNRVKLTVVKVDAFYSHNITEDFDPVTAVNDIIPTAKKNDSMGKMYYGDRSFVV